MQNHHFATWKLILEHLSYYMTQIYQVEYTKKKTIFTLYAWPGEGIEFYRKMDTMIVQLWSTCFSIKVASPS